jgi:hypothetical protein
LKLAAALGVTCEAFTVPVDKEPLTSPKKKGKKK